MLKKALIAVAATAAMISSAYAGQVIRVGTEPTFQPFEFTDVKTKEYVGYDMDMIRAAAKRAGYEVKIANMGFDGLIPALMTNNIDVIAAGMTVTADRAKKVNFTRPVYKTSQVILLHKADAANVKSEKDLHDQKLCVQIGTVGADKAKTIPGVKVMSFNTVADAYLELHNRGCKAAIMDKPVIESFLKQRASKGMIEVDTTFPTEDMAFAVNKGNKKLLDALNKALEEMEKSGETAQIQAKWFRAAK